MSMIPADGTSGTPGIVMMSPHTATTKPAPTLGFTSRIGTSKLFGRPSSAGPVESEYCVFAIHGKSASPTTSKYLIFRRTASRKNSLSE